MSTVQISIDGRSVDVDESLTVAAALLSIGQRFWRQSVSGLPRGLFCGIGVCHECTATIDDIPGTRACVTPVRANMSVRTETGPP